MDICRRTFGAALLAGMSARAFAAPSRPKLLVLIVLEKLSANAFTPVMSLLSTGGLRKLLDHAAHFPDCRHAASTFSATTLATLSTGAWPAQHGIVADAWFDRRAKRVVPASEEMLTATTLAAQVTKTMGGRAYVIGDSTPHAAMFAGTSSATVISMGNGAQFTARGDAPAWLADFNSQNSPESLHNAKWQAIGAKPDAPPIRTLTYEPNHPGEFQALYRSSYFAQSAPFTLLRELMVREHLGQGDGVDFVTVISSASALLGNETGSRSPLGDQMTLQLDREIETLLADLGRALGENGFALALAGGHGAPPLPLPAARPRMAVDGEALAHGVATALDENKLGTVDKYVYPFLYLDTSGWRDPEPVREAAARAAMENPAVANFYTAGGLCSTGDEWQRRFRNSFHAKHSGDVMLSYRPEYIEEFGQKRGVSYGSLYDYDVSVPLFLYGPQFRAGVYEGPVESVDLAPTLARVMGMDTPSSSVGEVLGEAIVA